MSTDSVSVDVWTWYGQGMAKWDTRFNSRCSFLKINRHFQTEIINNPYLCRDYQYMTDERDK